MHDTELMSLLQSIANGLQYRQQLIQSHWDARRLQLPKTLLEITTVQPLHDQTQGTVLCPTQVNNADCVSSRQGLQRLLLPYQAFDQQGVLLRCGRQHFDGDRLRMLEVRRSKHHTAPTPAHELVQLVAICD
jgi:hypothetical protein